MAHVFWNARLAASAMTTWSVVRYTITAMVDMVEISHRPSISS